MKTGLLCLASGRLVGSSVCQGRKALRVILQKASGVLEAHLSSHAGGEDEAVIRGRFLGTADS